MGRIRTIDVVKGLIIITIVFVHIFGSSHYQVGIYVERALLLQFCCALLMLFFIISGYFYRPNNGFLKNTKKRVIQIGTVLVIGYAILPLILWPYMAGFGNTVTLDDYIFCLKGLLGGNLMFQPLSLQIEEYAFPCLYVGYGYYFLDIMLFGFVIFYAIADRVRESLLRTVVSAVALTAVSFILMEYVGYHLPFYLELAPVGASFMVIGSYLGKRRFMERMEEKGYKDPRNWKILGITLASTLVLLYLFPSGTQFVQHIFGHYGYASVFTHLLTTTACGLFTLTLLAMVPRIPVVTDTLSFVGKQTIAILCLHIFIAKLIIAPFYRFGTDLLPILDTWQYIVLAVLCIILSIAISCAARELLKRLRKRYGNIEG